MPGAWETLDGGIRWYPYLDGAAWLPRGQEVEQVPDGHAQRIGGRLPAGVESTRHGSHAAGTAGVRASCGHAAERT